MRGLAGAAVRGAAGFAAGALVAALCAAPEFAVNWPARQGPPAWTFYLTLVGMFSSGAVGAAILTWGKVEARVTMRAAAGFGAGFVLAAIVVMFTAISLQGGGRPDTTWGAVGFGIGYALGGAIGAGVMSPRLAVAGAIAFGLAGALGGFVSFALAGRHVAPGNQVPMMLAGALALLVPYVLGGALFGGTIGLFGED